MLLIMFAAFSLLAWLAYYAYQPLVLPQIPLAFTLKHGTSLKGVAKQLTAASILREPWSFIALVRLFDKSKDIKAGSYELAENVTPLQLFYKITRGDMSQLEIAFIEGWTFKQMRKALDSHPDVSHQTTGLSDAEILKQIGAEEVSAEGLFFPDTYYFAKGMKDIDVLKRAYRIMQTNLADAWKGREAGLPFPHPYQALIMASIVERETAKAAERPLIAGVFINRLRLGMKLQTDPTVIYGMGDNFDGNLRKQDLQTDTSYNTYTRQGLPPTPIAMPGLEAIAATLHPAQTSALYFVAKGKGEHHFSSSLAEHNQAVARYVKMQGAKN